MSKDALAKVVQRAISDAGFRRQLSTDPAGALRGFDLSAEETSALRTGDAGRLSTLGVDQRMSKAFSLGGALAATKLSQSDLTSGSANVLDDGGSGSGGQTIIPHDPAAVGSADAGGSEAVNAKLPNDPDRFSTADLTGGAAGTGTVRVGDDWKFTDRAAQAHAAPVEGTPEADAAQPGTGMAAYPAHNGLAGPSGVQSVRAGDDWARSASVDADSARIGTARLDDSGGASGGASAINDDPDGFLAANANADLSGGTTGASAINDDPDGFLAANANADMSGSVTRANVVNDDPDGFLAANANADLSGGTTGAETGFIDESESYLTKVGYDANAADSAVTDAHDRGDVTADPASIADDDGGASNAGSEHGPNISS